MYAYLEARIWYNTFMYKLLNIKKNIIITIMCFLLLVGNSGCSYVRSGVLYSVYPIEYIIYRLSDGQIPTQSIQTNTIVQSTSIVENHEELLYTNAALFHIGNLEPYVELYKDEIKDSLIRDIDLSILNTIYRFERYTPVITDGAMSFIESPYYEGDAFDNVDIDDLDLFLWMDPIVMLSMAKSVYETLVLLYPEQQATMEDNLERLEADLIDLDANFQGLSAKLIEDNQQIKFVSLTASFGTWQRAYGLETYPVILSKYGVLPTDAQLEIIKSKILEDNVQYIVYETNMTDEMIELFDQLQSELGLTRVELSNLSSLTDAEVDEGKDYLSIMYENLSVLETMITDREAK